VKWIALIVALAMSCTPCPASPDTTAVDRASSGRAGASRSPRHLPRFEVEISYVANLVHWIDNLAGSSQGKTIRSYREYWRKRFGTPDAEEMELLRSWVAIRFKVVAAPLPIVLNRRGCLPQLEERSDWREIFLIRSYEATSVDAFVDSFSGDLQPEERTALRRVIERFRPRFDEAWKEMGYLPSFEERLRPFLDESGLRSFLGEVASFFDVNPDGFPPGRIELMALPEEGPTHAQANGRYLLIEVRPGDAPRDQIQVIAHETSHYLWHLVDPHSNDRLARQVIGAGSAGSVTWGLLREALPTAIGQGLADSRLSPETFNERSRWYHIDDVDLLAKEIYPIVRMAFERGKHLDGAIMRAIARRAETSEAVLQAPAPAYLGEGFFAAGTGMSDAKRELREKTPARTERSFTLSDPNGAAFVDRFVCMSGVVLLGPEDLKDLPRSPSILLPPSMTGAGAAPSSSGILTLRRPGGGILFYLFAASPGDAAKIATLFLGLHAPFKGPVTLEARSR
jgi:hypothetical protein